jgi:hypothetical protein
MSDGGEKYLYDVILTAAGIEDLDQRVSERLRKGWRCIGGVAVSTVVLSDGTFQIMIGQAMVRGE